MEIGSASQYLAIVNSYHLKYASANVWKVSPDCLFHATLKDWNFSPLVYFKWYWDTAHTIPSTPFYKLRMTNADRFKNLYPAVFLTHFLNAIIPIRLVRLAQGK